ncbi:MAG TPA: alpha/beta hydrolase family protein [Actinomycetota bacterium]|nr:alpha/beta hydrolase family protein [Actinomycetota bacterium]
MAGRARFKLFVTLVVGCIVLSLTPGGHAMGAQQVPVEGNDRLFEVTMPSPAMQRDMKFRILLPRGYADSNERYPVLYLLHGVGDDETTWTRLTDVEGLTEPLDLIVVMPDSGKNENAGWYSDWFNGGAFGPPRYESHHIGELIGYVEANYRALADRSQRLIAGHSMGGFGAMSYAARHPDLFVAAASFSGAVDTMIAEPSSWVAFQGLSFRGTPTTRVWGDQVQQEVIWRTHNPTDLVTNLRGVKLSAVSGDGTPGPGDAPQGAAAPAATEAGIRAMNGRFHAALEAANIPHNYREYSPGIHDWPYAQRNLQDALPMLMSALGTPAPTEFTYRTAEKLFSLYGWNFEVNRQVMEFMEIAVTSGPVLTLKGSGKVQVTTPSLFEPGSEVSVSIGPKRSGEPEKRTADSEGRIQFEFVLGPSNTQQEFTAASDAEKLSRGASYFRIAEVRFAQLQTTQSSGSPALAETGAGGLVTVIGVILLAVGARVLMLQRWRRA